MFSRIICLSAILLAVVYAQPPEGVNQGWPEPPCGWSTNRFRATGDFLSDAFPGSSNWNASDNNVLMTAVLNGTQCHRSVSISGLVPNKVYNWKITAGGSWTQFQNWGCPVKSSDYSGGNAPNCQFTASSTGRVSLNIIGTGTYPLFSGDLPPVDANALSTTIEPDVTFSSCQNPSSPCASSGDCCNQYGYCGNTADYCDVGNCFSNCPPQPTSDAYNPLAKKRSNLLSNSLSLTDGKWDNWGMVNNRMTWGDSQWDAVGGPPANTIRVKYPVNSWSGDNKGGIGFYAKPIANLGNYKTVRLTYQIAFGSGYNWNKGGKLPGLYGGNSNNNGGQGCSGGSTAVGCFSSRFMWRRNGDGEAYIYTDKSIRQSSDLCSVAPQSQCNPTYGSSIGRGAFRFQSGDQTYQTISMLITLNDIGSQNGVLEVAYNGKTVVNYRKLIWRKDASVKFSGIDFQTFFGGSDSSWATPSTQYVRFKKFLIEYQ